MGTLFYSNFYSKVLIFLSPSLLSMTIYPFSSVSFHIVESNFLESEVYEIKGLLGCYIVHPKMKNQSVLGQIIWAIRNTVWLQLENVPLDLGSQSILWWNKERRDHELSTLKLGSDSKEGQDSATWTIMRQEGMLLILGCLILESEYSAVLVATYLFFFVNFACSFYSFVIYYFLCVHMRVCMCIYVCVCEFMCIIYVQMLTEIRIKHWIFWK